MCPAPPEDDLQAFRAAMGDVSRRVPSQRESARPRPPPPEPRHSAADEAEVLHELLSGPDPDSFETGETLSYRAPGVQESVLRHLRRGGYRLEAELDLHGLNRDRAREQVAQFLTRCRDLDRRCVRIIHGKGKGSPNSGPVLKRQLDGWLRKVRDVHAFCSARPHDGGSGAIYVLLRRAG